MPAIIALAATFSCDPAVRWIRHWFSWLGIAVDVRLAPFGQLLSELSSPVTFHGAAACVGLLNFADWQPEAPFDAEKFQADLQLLIDCILSALAAVPRLLLLLCPSKPSAAAAAYSEAVERLEALACEQPRFSVLSPPALAAWYPVSEPHDIVGGALGLPYTEQLFCALGGATARGLLPTLAPTSAGLCKVIAVDCDFTLWHGAVGEIGADSIVVEPRHAELQERLLAMRAHGVLLALCSRNVASDVWLALDRNVMPLRKHHITAFRIDPLVRKSEALRSLAGKAALRLFAASLLRPRLTPSYRRTLCCRVLQMSSAWTWGPSSLSTITRRRWLTSARRCHASRRGPFHRITRSPRLRSPTCGSSTSR